MKPSGIYFYYYYYFREYNFYEMTLKTKITCMVFLLLQDFENIWLSKKTVSYDI